jgi:hypothetical protein
MAATSASAVAAEEATAVPPKKPVVGKPGKTGGKANPASLFAALGGGDDDEDAPPHEDALGVQRGGRCQMC